jgi:hypothetical protein
MPRFRRKPVEVEAYKLLPESLDFLSHWVGGRPVEETDAIDSARSYVGLNVPTSRGVKRASEGDYVVRDENGEIHVVPGPIFEILYDEL